MGSIAENIGAIKAKIAAIRPEAQLIAVSKMHDVSEIKQAIAAGQKLFGENRVQEAEAKFPQLKTQFPDLQLHLIGPLQTNKVKEALRLFDVIQTVDREKLAVAIAKSIEHRAQNIESMPYALCSEFFIQVNIGEEPQKAGVAPKDTESFYKFCKQELKLNVTGLMCIPPVDQPPSIYFTQMQNINSRLGNLKLSMGMSSDYEEALKLGADYVRVGTAIFGMRKV